MNKVTKVTVLVIVCAILILRTSRGQRLRCTPGSMVCGGKRSFITKQVKSNKFMLFTTPSR